MENCFISFLFIHLLRKEYLGMKIAGVNAAGEF
jgi:hypothetical protein